MSNDDWFYLAILIFCIPCGHLLKLCSSYYTKKVASCVIGILLTFILCGYKDLMHSFITIFGNYVVVKIIGIRYCRWISFLYVFFYLFIFRMCHHFGFPLPSKHANAVQLLVTLRMVSLPFELYDNDVKTNQDKNGRFTEKGKVSIFDFMGYGYCYIGLMTGPFYTFKTYEDMLLQDGSQITTVMPALRNLKLLPLIAVSYLIVSNYFPLDYLGTEDYLVNPWGVVYQLLILIPTFTCFRLRFYIAWLMAESMCMTAGLGAYPLECEAKPGFGPTKPLTKHHNTEMYGFETIRNINIGGVEFAPTMKAAMKEWNMTIQWWLATYVYKKLPIQSRQLRMFILLFVSAFWHGIHPGYYATFLSVPFVVLAETRMIEVIKPYLDAKHVYWLDWITCFCLYRSFEYLGVGFMLLKLESIWKVWTKMFFIGHFFIFLFILLPIVIPKKRQKTGEKNKD